MKTLDQICIYNYSGNQVTREQLGTGNYPSVKCGDINSHLPLQFKKCKSFVDPNLIKKPKYFEHGDILISKLGDRNTIGNGVLYLGNEKCLAGSDIEILKTNQNQKYIKYVLSSNYIREQIKNSVKGGTVLHFFPSQIKSLKIPLPPLKEQERIVRILDKFYDICENPDRGLQLLVKQNQKQYEYYRNLIFDQMKINN